MLTQPERLLVSLFIQASFKHPTSIGGQGIWFYRFWQQRQTDISLEALYNVPLTEELLERVLRVARCAHRHLTINPTPADAARVIPQVVRVAWAATVLDPPQHDTLLEMLDIYLGICPFVPTEGELDAQHPERLARHDRINALVQRDFPARSEIHLRWLVEHQLFNNLVSMRNFADVRFAEFILYLPDFLRINNSASPAP